MVPEVTESTVWRGFGKSRMRAASWCEQSPSVGLCA
jgi:hypothetical protein